MGQPHRAVCSNHWLDPTLLSTDRKRIIIWDGRESRKRGQVCPILLLLRVGGSPYSCVFEVDTGVLPFIFPNF